MSAEQLIEVCLAALGRFDTKTHEGKHPTLFDELVQAIADAREAPVHSFAEMRATRATKFSGDLFEEFSRRYLLARWPERYTAAWLLANTPPEVLALLSLDIGILKGKNGPRDYGIDIIIQHTQYGPAQHAQHGNAQNAQHPRYSAVQAKFRKNTKRYLGVTALSTFDALVSRSGPYEKHIVITTTAGIRRAGKRTPKDVSICIGTLRQIDVALMRSIMEMDPLVNPLTDEPAEPPVNPLTDAVTDEEANAGADAVLPFVNPLMVAGAVLPLTAEAMREARLRHFGMANNEILQKSNTS